MPPSAAVTSTEVQVASLGINGVITEIRVENKLEQRQDHNDRIAGCVIHRMRGESIRVLNSHDATGNMVVFSCVRATAGIPHATCWLNLNADLELLSPWYTHATTIHFYLV